MPIILTFDDSPSETTDDLLKFLEENNLKAVFFCIGNNLLSYPDKADNILKSSHIIANHSFSHLRFSSLGLKTIEKEIVKNDELIDNIYKRNGINLQQKYFRFPYGDKGVGWNPVKLIFRKYFTKFKTSQKILKKYGYKNFPDEYLKTNYILKALLYDIDVFTNFNPKDWQYNKINYEKVIKKTAKKDISKYFILQLHDKKENFDATILIIKNLVKKGARFELPYNLEEL